LLLLSTVRGGGINIKEIKSGELSVEPEDERIFGTGDEVAEFPYLASSIDLGPFWN
jgi:hypothetical protein